MSAFNDRFAGLSEAQRQQRYRQLAQACLDHYPVVVENISFIRHNAGIVYHVEAAQPDVTFLLKILHPVEDAFSVLPGHIHAGLRWLHDLAHQTNLIVQQPVPNRADELLTTVHFHDLDEPFYCSLQHWLDGDHPRDPTREQAYRIGKMMARLHQHASQWEPASRLPAGVIDEDSLKESFNRVARVVDLGILSPSGWAKVDAASQHLFTMIQTLGREPAVWGPIHGDLHHDNILFKDSDARPIDFGGLRVGHFAYDLGVTLYHFMYLDVSIRQALIVGYEEIHGKLLLPHLALEAFICAAAVDNLAFQVMLPDQLNSALFTQNVHQFANEFCGNLISDRPYVLVKPAAYDPSP